ncbi:MAG: NAD(P)-dependent oxidoreductase [Alphaproteobacteria bacterium]|nr:NAD(P)-dependent oxidoreductase [Alphaproteobacteria bacterium]
MRVFVTGATGRIGLPLVEALRAQGHDVLGLARSDVGEAALCERGAAPIRGDLNDAEALRRGAEGAEWVFHLAGGVRGPGRVTPDVLNRQGTEAMLAACRGVPELRAFVLASSGAVYGDRSNLWVEEDFEPSPNTRYGRSKADAEALVRQATAEGALPGVIARLAAVYGPGFPFAMAEPIAEGRCWLPGEGRNHVPTVHVTDCVNGLIRLAEAGQPGEAYHIADRSQPTLGAFFEAVAARVGGTPPRFWSTYVPSYVQLALARQVERAASRLGLRPRLTPDALKLWTASVRLRTERLDKELGFEWAWPDHQEGIAASFPTSA